VRRFDDVRVSGAGGLGFMLVDGGDESWKGWDEREGKSRELYSVAALM
jgi:hypothetical protein